MAKYSALTDNAHDTVKQSPKVGVLLTNLGTPDAPDAPALRRYLAEFLSDPRIVEIPQILWKIILHGIILRVRPKKSAALYASIWTDEGSPLLAIAQKQQRKIAESLAGRAQVALGMRYGNPSIASALQQLQQSGVRKIIVLPLYPQYAAATVGSTFDALARELTRWRWVPELSFISGYAENDTYLEALAATLREHQAQHGTPQKWVFSYHGTPKFSLEKGDPYYCFCVKTTRQAAARAGLNPDDCLTTFQSRFGKAEWLKPYTDQTLAELPQQGVKNIAILSPAFSADCLETLEELEEENRETFIEAGGEQYHYIAALNDRDDHIRALVEVIEQRL
ncbi:ferrochelatase [Gilvimarinus sp. 1_MG-2023]|uniref:ferrochelatase n=1 Tax=Gilvimarinus sp. 1_MG-2023 TaxID=3062638 RepID=UPI0026E3B15A|nr:ferrochelatase [Gilvimarinus sp. 1_MG-2023]MDO6746515.1 ferrochelatase [Gilvimarinus sp. 1_MG-2023]